MASLTLDQKQAISDDFQDRLWAAEEAYESILKEASKMGEEFLAFKTEQVLKARLEKSIALTRLAVKNVHDVMNDCACSQGVTPKTGGGGK